MDCAEPAAHAEGFSKVLQAEAVVTSLVLFAFIYALLFVLFVYLLNDKIQHGPDEADLTPTGKLAHHLHAGDAALRAAHHRGHQARGRPHGDVGAGTAPPTPLN